MDKGEWILLTSICVHFIPPPLNLTNWASSSCLNSLRTIVTYCRPGRTWPCTEEVPKACNSQLHRSWQTLPSFSIIRELKDHLNNLTLCTVVPLLFLLPSTAQQHWPLYSSLPLLVHFQLYWPSSNAFAVVMWYLWAPFRGFDQTPWTTITQMY